MNLSMRWLREFVDIDENINMREFSEAITMSGSKVESFEKEGSELKNIVVGRVLSTEKHPAADRLTVCKVDVGEAEPIQIVTAATNVVPDVLVPVARIILLSIAVRRLRRASFVEY